MGKTVLAIALAVAVTSPALAKANYHAHKPAIARQAGLRAFNSIAPAPATPSADGMKWSPEKAGGGSIGYNTHDEVKN
jgi:hypothetical protein